MNSNEGHNERWKETRDLLKQALTDWETSQSHTPPEATTTPEDAAEKERLEKLLHMIKEKMDELSI